MAIRTTVDIPEPVYEALRERAQRTGTSIRALILRAIEDAYQTGRRGAFVRGPLVKGPGRLGSKFPKDENPHDLVFS
jgi:hypothetical protein